MTPADSFAVPDGIVFLPKAEVPSDPAAAYYLEQIEADIGVARQTLVNATNNVNGVQQEHIDCALEHLNHALYWASKSVN